jgi:hypothetical protein
LTFDPLTQKWIGGHLLVMNNQHIKFIVPRPKRSLVITQKPFLPTRSMWPWPLTPWPKNHRCHQLVINNHHTMFEIPRPRCSLVITRELFYLQGQCYLDLWRFDPKINRVHLLIMINHHTKFEVPRPKRSLVITRNPFGLRTDGLIDRPTDECKAISPHFFEGGHNKKNKVNH